MSHTLIPVDIWGETFHADVVGLIQFPETGRQLLGCLGVIGRRAGLSRALAIINDGQGCRVDGVITDQLGKKRYRVLQIPMGKGLQRLFLLPSSTLVISQNRDARKAKTKGPSSDDNALEDGATQHFNVLVWRGNGNATLVAWRAIMQASNIPLLDAWGPVIMPILADADRLDRIRQDMGLSARQEARFQPMDFLANVDGRFQGGLINVDENDLIAATRHGLLTGAIAA